MTKIDFLEFVQAICKRPKMYTPTGAFYEVASFLEGYGGATDVGISDGYHMIFTPFLKWILQKFDLKEEIGISGWVRFRELFESDSEAIERLPILYNEFLETQ
jgi:hypothetical protein